MLANSEAIETITRAAELTSALCTTTLGRIRSVSFLVTKNPMKRA